MAAPRILIVEDEVIFAQDVEIKLRRMGHDVLAIATTGEEAVEIALRQKPDLILMDIALPGGIDGIEAAARIHAHTPTPVVYLTALSDEETLQRAKITEPFAYIQKPLASRELHIAVEVALYKYSVQRQISLQLERMTAMRMIDQAIITSHDLHWTLQVALSQTCIHLKVDASAIMMLSPFSGLLEYFETYGFHAQHHIQTRLKLGHGWAGHALSEGKRIVLPNVREQNDLGPDERLSWMRLEGFVSYIAVPLASKAKVLGVLEIFHRAPLNPTADWFDFLETLAGQVAIAVENITLVNQLSSANVELVQSYNATIAALSAALELRDNDTEGHSQRVTDLTVQMARALGITGEALDHMRRGALLHDMGKLGIPDDILLKQGELTPDEWQIMRRHPLMAREMLSSIPFLRPALEIPLYHHERWDGSGYPYGLAGEKIPLSARIFALADVTDALLSDRPYRRAWPLEKVVAHLRTQSGKHFDASLVERFIEIAFPHQNLHGIV